MATAASPAPETGGEGTARWPRWRPRPTPAPETGGGTPGAGHGGSHNLFPFRRRTETNGVPPRGGHGAGRGVPPPALRGG